MNLFARLVARSLKLPEPATHSVRVRRNILVRMEDGVALKTDLYMPIGLERPPVVLVRSPYGKGVFFAGTIAQPLAERGFLVVLQCCRGTQGSGGVFEPFHHERSDGLATLEWIKKQSWFGDAIFTYGLSYLGFTQWAVAREAGAEVKAMAMQVTLSNIADMHYAGGSLMLENAMAWTNLVSKMAKPFFGARMILGLVLGRPPISPAQWRHLPLSYLDTTIVGARVPFWQEWIEHASVDDPWWSATDFHRTLAEVRRPISMVAGWFDIFLPWQLRDFQELQTAGVPVRLTVGPWRHADSEIRRAGLIDALEWFRGIGKKNQTPSRLPVRVYVTGARIWRDFDQWPPRDSNPVSWYLQTNRGFGPEVSVSRGYDRFVYDPNDPTPTLGGPSLETTKPYAQDNRELERRADVLCYTSALLAHDCDVIGPIEADLHVAITAAQADLFVRLCDVDRDGVSRNVCDGLRRFKSASASGIQAVKVQLWPIAHRFEAGHRLRIQISGGAFPRWARNLGTEEPLGSAERMVTNPIVVHFGGEHASTLRLPLAAT